MHPAFRIQSALRSILIAAHLIILASSAFAMSEGCGGECATCHPLTVKEANVILNGIGHVVAVKPAPVRGLFELTLEKDGKTGLAYMDYGKKHLIGGQILDIASRQVVGASGETAKPPKERLDPATLPTRHALVMGNAKGKMKLFVFTDPECPFCAKMHEELKKLVALEPDLAIYIEMFPLKMHPHAYDKARVILGRKSLALLEKSFAGGKLPEPGAKDAKKPVDDLLHYAESVGINSTPTLVLSDGRILPGLKDAEAILKLLR